MKQRRVIVSVINDLVSDRRVHRTCTELCHMGFEVLLVGRRRRRSPAMDSRQYTTKRMKLWFETGPLFYFCFNIRLLILLLFGRKPALLYSNDLDTLLPNFLVSRLRRIPLVYDAHEYFTGVPELTDRPQVQKVWRTIERFTVPKISHMITVNHSIADLYTADYGVRPVVVRNVPSRPDHISTLPSRDELNLPTETKILIFQGAGINVHRGAEEAVQAIRYLDGVLLLFVGDGDVVETLKQTVSQQGLDHKVQFIPRVPMEVLHHYTRLADGGLTLDKDTNINYRYSLPNKLFDYIHAGIPVLASDLPEISRIVNHYNIGLVTSDHDPEILSEAMRTLLFDQQLREQWSENLPQAAADLCWEKEREVLLNLIKSVCP
jgi:glycosyltransferase involved in cell wall biosynthesis